MQRNSLELLIILVVVCAGFSQPSFSQSPTTISKIDKSNENPSAKTTYNRYFILQPGETKDSIKIDESCLILLREMPVEITFPLGKPIKTILPAGTKYLVPAGSYDVQNTTGFVLEYRLTAATECRREK